MCALGLPSGDLAALSLGLGLGGKVDDSEEEELLRGKQPCPALPEEACEADRGSEAHAVGNCPGLKRGGDIERGPGTIKAGVTWF